MTSAVAPPTLPPERRRAVLEHLNEDHAAELALLWRAAGGNRGETPRAVGVSATALDLRCGEQTHSVPLPHTETLRSAIRAAVVRAREALGLPARALPGEWTAGEVREVLPGMLRVPLSPQDRVPLSPQDGVPLSPQDGVPNGLPCGLALRVATPERRTYTVCQGGAALWIDVLLHGDSAGSRWARGLRPGDPVRTLGERPEALPDFSRGGLLLGDGTALPTVAALLRGWHGPPPTVALELPRAQLAGVGAYLESRPPGCTLLLAEQTRPGAALQELVRGVWAPAVWGACESGAATALREELRARLGLRDACRITGYWKESA